MEIINAINIINNDFKANGSNQVEAALTSEEISALVNKANQRVGPIKDVKIRFLNNNELEHVYTISDSAINHLRNSGILGSLSLNSNGRTKTLSIR